MNLLFARPYTPDKPYRYLYLRTKTKLCHAVREFGALAEALACPTDVLACFPSRPTWENAVALRFRDDASVHDLADELRQPLSAFDHWVLQDLGLGIAEPIGTLASLYYDETGADPDGGPSTAQIFLVQRREDKDPDLTALAIKDAIHAEARTGFHMDSGRIILVRTDQSATLLRRRIEAHSKLVYEIVICDRNGETCDARSRGEDLWLRVDLDVFAEGGFEIEEMPWWPGMEDEAKLGRPRFPRR